MSLDRIFFTIFKTKPGWIGLLSNNIGLLKTTLPKDSKDEAEDELRCRSQAIYSEEIFKEIIAQINSYFEGKRVDFTARLDISQATVFEQAVWQATRRVSYGETSSYLKIAGEIRKPLAARAVGQALGRNPIPIIIPCHRILNNNGRLGGFGGGLEMKKYLLDLEAKGKG
jgi:methylated-DNA-[protein]-cysteine S-methyltransferase